MRPISIIVAATKNTMGIGKNGKIPFYIQQDMKQFRKITLLTDDVSKMNAVIMGRKTYESIGFPLPNRLNIVISRNRIIKYTLNIPDNVVICHSLQDALQIVNDDSYDSILQHIFIIGGETIYREAILLDCCKKIYVTLVEQPVYHKLDTFFPFIDGRKYYISKRSDIQEENNVFFRFMEYDSIT